MTAPRALHKILVVEDDPISRIALSGVLRRLPGVSVIEAQDGQAAWDLLEQGLRPALCCTDIQMDRLDGLALMERVRADPVLFALPVVFITGASDRQTVQAAIRQNAAGFIVKPFNAATTLETVQRVMAEAQVRQAEPPEQTRARLGRPREELGRLLGLLAADVHRERISLYVASTDTTRPERLARLRTTCRNLGLWYGADLLRPGAAEAGIAVLEAQLRELGEALFTQLGRLYAPAIPAAPTQPDA